VQRKGEDSCLYQLSALSRNVQQSWLKELNAAVQKALGTHGISRLRSSASGPNTPAALVRQKSEQKVANVIQEHR
jgi:hypothetical protein